jgi:hypothetical protein
VPVIFDVPAAAVVVLVIAPTVVVLAVTVPWPLPQQSLIWLSPPPMSFCPATTYVKTVATSTVATTAIALAALKYRKYLYL